MAVMATKEFGLGPAEFGLLGSILAVGSFTGVLVSARLEHLRVPKFVMAGGVMFGLLLTIAAWMPNYGSFAAILPILGGVALLTLISANSYVQTNSDPKLRGRVMGIYLLIFMGGTPIGSPLIGLFAEAVGIRWAIFACGVVVLIASSIIYFLLVRNPGQDPITEGLPVIPEPSS